MTILEIHKNYHITSGADRHFFDVARLMSEHGHTVVPFSMHHALNASSPYEKYFVPAVDWNAGGVKNIPRLASFFYSRRAARNLAALIRETKPDVAHVHLIYHHLTGAVLATLKKFNIPTVFTIHDWKVLCPNAVFFTEGAVCERCRGGKFYNAFMHRCMQTRAKSLLVALEAYVMQQGGWYQNAVARFIAPSAFVKEKFISFGYAPERITVVPHFLHPLSPPLGARVQQRLSTIMGRDPYALYVGRLSHEKGVEFLLETWVQEKMAHRLILMGRGPLREKLDRYIKNKQAGTRITILDFANEDEARFLMQRAHVTLMPSRVYETFGLSAAESLRLGVPVVASALGGQAEMINASGGGWTFPNGNHKACAAAIREAFEDTALRDARGAAGAAYATRVFSPDVYATTLEKLFTSLI